MLVHHGCKGLFGTRHVLRQRYTRVIAGLDDVTVQEFIDGHRLVDVDEHARTFLLPGVLADHGLIVELHELLAQRVGHRVDGHDLGQARRLHRHVRFLRGERFTGVVVEQDIGLHAEVRRRRNVREFQRRGGADEERNEQCADDAFHRVIDPSGARR